MLFYSASSIGEPADSPAEPNTPTTTEILSGSASLCLDLSDRFVSLAFARGGDPPAITALEAAKLADDYLRNRALLGSTYIESITLENGAVLRPERHWFVRWDTPLRINGMQKEEIGLKVTMKGKVTRLVR